MSSAWETVGGKRGDNVNVINNTADAHEFGAEVTADCRKISVHARPYGRIEPRLVILRAKDDVKDDLAERLGHGANDDRNDTGSESRFQRWRFLFHESWGDAPGYHETARLWR
jgi:hypothetical protein